MRRRTIVSAVVRSSSGVWLDDSSATNMISPMMDESGANAGGSTASGRAPLTAESFSVTVWRAR